MSISSCAIDWGRGLAWGKVICVIKDICVNKHVCVNKCLAICVNKHICVNKRLAICVNRCYLYTGLPELKTVNGCTSCERADEALVAIRRLLQDLFLF